MNTKQLYLALATLLLPVILWGQSIPAERLTNWYEAGFSPFDTGSFVHYNLESLGIIGDGITSNSSLLDSLLSLTPEQGAILTFPAGDFFFDRPLRLRSNVVLRGSGAESTKLIFSLNSGRHAIAAEGTLARETHRHLRRTMHKGENFALIDTSDGSMAGAGLFHLFMDDEDLVTSSWAQHTVGQIFRVRDTRGDTLFFDTEAALDYPTERKPRLRRILPIENIVIECLSILRLDNTAPTQSSNIAFNFAYNAHIHGIESEYCTFSHIEARYSSKLTIASSFFHKGFEYGGGGRAYGVTLHFSTCNSRVEDNIFEHLRHSTLLQAGANSNVFAFNFSTAPYWEGTALPATAAGELTLHGNYVFGNLFEQNIVQNIVVDNSHGPNGPDNFFFRNRADRWGIFFSAANSPHQIIVGNEITNRRFPYSVVNFTILGAGHFLHCNNNKGRIVPTGTEHLDEQSFAYRERPDFVPIEQWSTIGTQGHFATATIPAQIRHWSEAHFAGICGLPPITSVERDTSPPIATANFIFDNSSHLLDITLHSLDIRTPLPYFIVDLRGAVVHSGLLSEQRSIVQLPSELPNGMYFLHIEGVFLAKSTLFIGR